MRADITVDPKEQHKQEVKKSNIINFMLNASIADISTKVDDELDGATAAELQTQMRKLFKVVFVVLAYILRKVQ